MARLASGRASRTARMTAAMRARHSLGGSQPLVFDDRFARHFLDFGSVLMAAPTPLSDWGLGRLLGPVRGIEGEVLARSRYVEEALAPLLDAGLDQVLILGAGFDTTALAHMGSDAHFFEVDHPATQAEKRRIFARHPEWNPNLTFVPVDFAKDDLAVALIAAGFAPARQSMTSWLGVTMYLDQAVTLATLAALRRVVAAGSVLIFDAFPQLADIDANERALVTAARAMTASRGERITDFDLAAFEGSVPATGWRIADMMRGAAMRERWFAEQPLVLHPPDWALFCTLEAV